VDTTFGPVWMLGAPAATAAVVFVAGARAGAGRAWEVIGLLWVAVAVIAAGIVTYLLGVHEPMWPNTRNTLVGIGIATAIELGGLAVIGLAAYRLRSSRRAELASMASAVALTTMIAWVAWMNCVIPAACRIFD
jgi:hypothetical protein